jgi:hypothetical protein
VDTVEWRQLTVMFGDLVDSTALASRLDPEDFREVIGAYHKCVAETIGLEAFALGFAVYAAVTDLPRVLGGTCRSSKRLRNRWFESGSLQRRVLCEPDFLNRGAENIAERWPTLARRRLAGRCGG